MRLPYKRLLEERAGVRRCGVTYENILPANGKDVLLDRVIRQIELQHHLAAAGAQRVVDVKGVGRHRAVQRAAALHIVAAEPESRDAAARDEVIVQDAAIAVTARMFARQFHADIRKENDLALDDDTLRPIAVDAIGRRRSKVRGIYLTADIPATHLGTPTVERRVRGGVLKGHEIDANVIVVVPRSYPSPTSPHNTPHPSTPER